MTVPPTRQGILQAATAFAFYLPLALILPPRSFLTHKSINIVYQFWVHTTLIRRLGPYEWFFMTPSHHRVHHDRRVHKNFGGVLVIWDKLFGSFLDEDEKLKSGEGRDAASREPWAEKCFFGQRRPMASVGSGLHQLDEPLSHFGTVGALVRRRRIVAAANALYRGPGWHTAGLRRRNALPETSSAPRVRLPPTAVPVGTQLYVGAASTLSLLLILQLLISKAAPGDPEPAAIGATIVTALLGQSLLLDGVRGGWPLEAVRAAATAAVWFSTLGDSPMSPIVCGGTALTFVAPLLSLAVPRSASGSIPSKRQ
mmetsp:Transcript_15458/g.45930  ORF Transcript_15458/g.45930 Transcript_15458/m.45930 type:complete len:312 (-) Transcript_15458:146-1081(-)